MSARDVTRPEPAASDVFGTSEVRRQVLEAWTASATRFREDANAEEDLVRGGYRDRVVVELAQNAADAAARAGTAGRVSFRVDGDVVVVSNTGVPLDKGGVESLSTLRASAKRGLAREDATVGRFGVGFAAVLAVTDAPAIASTTGAVRWSLDEARAVVGGTPALARELDIRGGHVPVLRLPWPDDAEPEPGYATTVRLPLRDARAGRLVRRLLDDVDDALLLSLPALERIVIEYDDVRRVVEDGARWHVVRRSGRLDARLLTDRPTEERSATSWSVAWARPVAGQEVPATVHAPTATDEPLELPAMLIATFPLDPSRRHVAAGALTDFLVTQASGAYTDMAAELDDPLAVVPRPAIVGALDGRLRRAIVDAMSQAPLLETRDGARVRPRDAVAVIDADAGLRSMLHDVLPGLVADAVALDRLGVRRLEIADVVDLLGDLERPPPWWHRLYDAMQGVVAAGRGDSLGALPVPIADGRLVRGARGLLVAAEPPPPGLEVLGLRIVHPQAAHRLLLRLGAVEAAPRTMLADPAVRAAVEDAAEAIDASAVTDAVLSLVEQAGLAPGELPWLSDILLPDATGVPTPAGDLVLPGSLLAETMEPDILTTPHESVLSRWPPEVLAVAGVLSSPRVVRDEDVSFDAVPDDLPDVEDWVDHVLSGLPEQELPPLLTELVAISDLDVVRSDAWPRVLREISEVPELRAAVVEPARLLLAEGRQVDVTSYPAWWLRRHARLRGHAPEEFALRSARNLHGLYDVLEADAIAGTSDERFLSAIGVRTSLETLLAEPGGPDDVLCRLADPDVHISDEQLSELYVALAQLDPDRVPPPNAVRVRADVVVPAADAVVITAPHHLQLPWPAAPPLVVPLSVAEPVADLLDIASSSDVCGGVGVNGGRAQRVAQPVGQLLGDDAPKAWAEHDELVVASHAVDWWVNPDGSVHACTVDGLAKGLAWSAGRWELRLLVAALLAAPDQLEGLLLEARLET